VPQGESDLEWWETRGNRDFKKGSTLVSVLMLAGGVFIINLSVGWHLQRVEDIPLIIQLGFFLLGGLMVAGGVYIPIVAVYERGPLKVTDEGLYLPAHRFSFQKTANQKLLPADEIADIMFTNSSIGVKITIITKSGKKIKTICNEKTRRQLEEFWRERQAA
jgi:hypothetical protein